MIVSLMGPIFRGHFFFDVKGILLVAPSARTQVLHRSEVLDMVGAILLLSSNRISRRVDSSESSMQGIRVRNRVGNSCMKKPDAPASSCQSCQ